MRKILNFACMTLLVAGLCGCEKMYKEIDENNLEGQWQKEYAKGVQDAGQVLWNFSDSNNPESQHWQILTITVSDVFTGDSKAKYIYIWHQNGYKGVGGSTPELYLYELNHDFMAEEDAYTPAARYYVEECTKSKLVLKRIEANVDKANLLEGDVTFKRVK